MIFQYIEREHRKHPEEPKNTTVQPIVPIKVYTPQGEFPFDALVDTGSELTIFPKLGSDTEHLTSVKSWVKGIDGTGYPIILGRSIKLQLKLDEQMYEWIAEVWFSENSESKPTLGHRGFLEFFTATFDGENRQLNLKHNTKFPGESVNLWKETPD